MMCYWGTKFDRYSLFEWRITNNEQLIRILEFCKDDIWKGCIKKLQLNKYITVDLQMKYIL